MLIMLLHIFYPKFGILNSRLTWVEHRIKAGFFLAVVIMQRT